MSDRAYLDAMNARSRGVYQWSAWTHQGLVMAHTLAEILVYQAVRRFL